MVNTRHINKNGLSFDCPDYYDIGKYPSSDEAHKSMVALSKRDRTCEIYVTVYRKKAFDDNAKRNNNLLKEYLKRQGYSNIRENKKLPYCFDANIKHQIGNIKTTIAYNFDHNDVIMVVGNIRSSSNYDCIDDIKIILDTLQQNNVIKSIKGKPSSKNKTAIVSIIVVLVIILFILVPVLTYNPWDSDASSQVEEYYVDASSEPYTVDCPEGFEIGNGGTTRYEYFGHDFVNDTIYWGDGYCAISVNHHDANGKSLNHYLKVLKQGDMVKVYKVKKTTVDGNKGYKITGNFLDEDTSWVMFIHDDEYYLINFENVPKTIQKEFLNSFKFK